MAIKVVNNTASPNSLFLILLAYRAYLCMHSIDPPTVTIIQKAIAIKKAIEQVRKI